jgi:hypothetical protein
MGQQRARRSPKSIAIETAQATGKLRALAGEK